MCPAVALQDGAGREAVDGEVDDGGNDIEIDLTAFLRATVAAAQDPDTAHLLRALAAEASRDPNRPRSCETSSIPAEADLDLLIDQVHGLFWYRLLLGHAPLSTGTATLVVRSLLGRG